MTGADWNSCNDVPALLSHLWAAGKLSGRKARLFSVAAYRRVWSLLDDENNRKVVEAVEFFADETPDHVVVADTWVAPLTALLPASNRLRVSEGTPPAARFMVRGLGFTGTACQRVANRVCRMAFHATNDVGAARKAPPGLEVYAAREAWAAATRASAAEREAQASLIRCIFANPFVATPSISPSCLTPAVLSLAERAYAERHLPEGQLDGGRLAVLADALEAAGCTDAELLTHLRSPAPHVRGCFAVDAVLGRG